MNIHVPVRATRFQTGHVELHTMAESGRTIRVLCDCARGADHVYAGRSDGTRSEAAATPR